VAACEPKSARAGHARAKARNIPSSLTKTGWVVIEGAETVSRHSNQKANEMAAVAGRKAYADWGLAQAVLQKQWRDS